MLIKDNTIPTNVVISEEVSFTDIMIIAMANRIMILTTIVRLLSLLIIALIALTHFIMLFFIICKTSLIIRNISLILLSGFFFCSSILLPDRCCYSQRSWPCFGSASKAYSWALALRKVVLFCSYHHISVFMFSLSLWCGRCRILFHSL